MPRATNKINENNVSKGATMRLKHFWGNTFVELEAAEGEQARKGDSTNPVLSILTLNVSRLSSTISQLSFLNTFIRTTKS